MNQEFDVIRIKSLHRPANSRLKTVKHVCRFIEKEYKKDTNFRAYFAIHIVKLLIKYYEKDLPQEKTKGILSKTLIYNIQENFIETKSVEEQVNHLHNFDLENKNKDDLDRNIFTLLKTVMYYVTLAKTFHLINNDMTLTKDGKKFSSLRTPKNFVELTLKEKYFLFKCIIKSDYTFFIGLININKLIKKYKEKDIEQIHDIQLNFISTMVDKNEFLYKRRSWVNYMWIRSLWIEDLDCIDFNGNLRQNFKKIINSDIIDDNFEIFLKNELKNIENSYFKIKLKYKKLLKEIDLAYVNIINKFKIKNYKFISLYDICDELNLSHNKMQWFLNNLALDKDNWIRVNLHNVIGNADTRKRFYINTVPVINIKINERLK